MTSSSINRKVVIDYTDHSGNHANRTVVPHEIYFGATVYTKTEQWFITAWDEERQEELHFALKRIKGWRPA